MATTLTVQRRLKELGIYDGALDGVMGPKTRAAIRGFQRINGLDPDGKAGPKTYAKLFPEPMPEREEVPQVVVPPKTASSIWPRQRDCAVFYGAPGNPKCTAGIVFLPFAFRIAWNLNQRVSTFKCHEKVAEPMTRIFKEAAEHYGENEYRALGLDLFGGCYNLRQMRGGSYWSMHSWGIAVDLDPARNQLKWRRDRAQFAKPAYEPFWKIVEQEGALSLGRARNYDWMHWQFSRL
jgi:hypothetical protein